MFQKWYNVQQTNNFGEIFKFLRLFLFWNKFNKMCKLHFDENILLLTNNHYSINNNHYNSISYGYYYCFKLFKYRLT